MRFRDSADFWSGVMFCAFGLLFTSVAQNYPWGDAHRMGPAYVPTILGSLLVVLGLVIAALQFAGRSRGGAFERIHFGPLVYVLGAVVVHGLLLQPGGVLIATAALVLIASFGSDEFKWREAVGVSVAMSVIIYTVFVWGLEMPIPIMPAFMM